MPRHQLAVQALIASRGAAMLSRGRGHRSKPRLKERIQGIGWRQRRQLSALPHLHLSRHVVGRPAQGDRSGATIHEIRPCARIGLAALVSVLQGTLAVPVKGPAQSCSSDPVITHRSPPRVSVTSIQTVHTRQNGLPAGSA
jgi:hypothetical protein